MPIVFSQQTSLKPFNSFGIEAQARYFTQLNALADLPLLLNSQIYNSNPVLWLGGGSNVLFTADFDGLVVKIATHGIHALNQEKDYVLLEVAAGENWHDFVCYTLRQGWFGLENLSLIPGTVGAAPIQNIGAYGSEVKTYIDSIVCANLNNDGEQLILSAKECNFAYRNSIFKRDRHLLITAVRFRLNTIASAQTEYGDIQKELLAQGVKQKPSPQQVARAIIALRNRKLPDPKLIGNAGSFFKNPLVSAKKADQLLEIYPDLAHYPSENGKVKLAAAWLIERAGLKAYRQADAAVHDKQALVLVNHGKASGAEIIQLANYVQKTVYARYGVSLEIEPSVI